MGNYAYGDSITLGTGSTGGYNYIGDLNAALGVTFSNNGVSGDQAADTAIKTHNLAFGASDRATLMIGTNDQWKYGTDSFKQSLYKNFLIEIIADLSLPTKTHGIDAGMTYTGTWSTSQPTWSKGKLSTIAGSTATATVSGTAIYIGVIKQDNLNGNSINGTADVYVDNVLVGSVGSVGTGMTTQNGKTYAPAAYRFGGLSSGSHQVKLVVTSAFSDYRGTLYLEYIAGNSQANYPNVYVSNIPRYNSTGYTNFGGSDTNMAVYNGIVSSVVTDAMSDSSNVHFVDTSSKLNQTTDLSSDGVHPVNPGHFKIATVFNYVISGFTPN